MPTIECCARVEGDTVYMHDIPVCDISCTALELTAGGNEAEAVAGRVRLALAHGRIREECRAETQLSNITTNWWAAAYRCAAGFVVTINAQ
jgi:hypothetical protein